MKAFLSPIGRLPSAICFLLSSFCCLAQPQQAWVQRYNGGLTTKTNTPLAMKLDSAGNIYVAGSSQNSSNFYDYVVLKYAPNGTLLWTARYSPTNGGTYPANGFALDQNGNTYLTGGIIQQGGQQSKTYVIGNGATVKFDTNGQMAWAAPYTGNDVAADTNGNVYVTGFSTMEYSTVKLDVYGSNLWTRTYVGVTGPDNPVSVSQKVSVDNVGNAYVAGWADYHGFYYPGKTNMAYYSHPIMLMYDALGNLIWADPYEGVGGINWGDTKGLIPDNQGNVYIMGNTGDRRVAKVDSEGQTQWTQNLGSPPPGIISAGITLDSSGNAYLSGGGYLAVKLASTNGEVIWSNYQYTSSDKSGNGIVLDKLANVYLVADPTASGFATIKCDANGNKQWFIPYNSSPNGNAGATAITVASDGSIYVTGYSQNTFGGTDITTIKYGGITSIQKNSDRSMRLQSFGVSGQTYYFQATTNFVDWDSVGSSLADTNGMFEYLDTNAPLFPYRFYRWYMP